MNELFLIFKITSVRIKSLYSAVIDSWHAPQTIHFDQGLVIVVSSLRVLGEPFYCTIRKVHEGHEEKTQRTQRLAWLLTGQ